VNDCCPPRVACSFAAAETLRREGSVQPPSLGPDQPQGLEPDQPQGLESDQPPSGERMQPTAQAVGRRSKTFESPAGAKEPSRATTRSAGEPNDRRHPKKSEIRVFRCLPRPAVWKSRPSSRTKPVIARDTTYCVSLLTGTISGSNLAIPSTKFRSTGMGRENWKGPVIGTRHEVARYGAQEGKLGRPGF
jgi:hypothetical protein